LAVLEHTGRRLVRVETGEIVAVLGAPGSGKTRLGLEMAFLARPQEGEVLLNGSNPMARRSRFDMRKRPHDVTMLVQNAEDQLFARTVFDDIAFGPRRLDLSEDQIKQRVNDSLRAVRLDASVRERSPFALSGGERRRVALAGVLAMRPEALILDEPTANLDPQTRNDFLELLAPLRADTAIVWLTARAREASLANRVYFLNDEETRALPAGADLLHHWRELADAGIELPGVFELAGLLERRDWELPAEGTAEELTAAIVAGWRQRHDDR